MALIAPRHGTSLGDLSPGTAPPGAEALESEIEAETLEHLEGLETLVSSAGFLSRLSAWRPREKQRGGPKYPRGLATEAAIADALATPIGSSGSSSSSGSGSSGCGAEPSSTSAGAGAGAATRSAPLPAAATADSDAECGDSDADAANDSFVLIDRADAVDALACFVAEALLKCPQAQSMSPKQLQEGLVKSIKDMKRSRLHKLCTAGQKTYRWGALGYSAFQMYSNPWIYQAILTAMWHFSRAAVGIPPVFIL
ncbi:hypothetical protein FOA52_010586 [Chlamydomonas sp. UWO 241]|nr:hypothetical protein FOA52_010586 [Chlamydomonas sp. UWO 241]